ncbi:MAG: hypothetical protein ACPHVX_01160, partial [Flavobacteriaceae bacterium]
KVLTADGSLWGNTFFIKKLAFVSTYYLHFLIDKWRYVNHKVLQVWALGHIHTMTWRSLRSR